MKPIFEIERTKTVGQKIKLESQSGFRFGIQG